MLNIDNRFKSSTEKLKVKLQALEAEISKDWPSDGIFRQAGNGRGLFYNRSIAITVRPNIAARTERLGICVRDNKITCK